MSKFASQVLACENVVEAAMVMTMRTAKGTFPEKKKYVEKKTDNTVSQFSYIESLIY